MAIVEALKSTTNEEEGGEQDERKNLHASKEAQFVTAKGTDVKDKEEMRGK